MALCCRLTVLLMPGDRVPAHMIERTPRGDEQMARGEDGWCVAIDEQRQNCSIYEQRPSPCREFAPLAAHGRRGDQACDDARRRHGLPRLEAGA